MSSGKSLKIVDSSLVRSKNRTSSEAIPAVADRVRIQSNRHYRDYIPKKTRDGRWIQKASNSLIYGDPAGLDKTKMVFSNSLVSEIHYNEATERCGPRLYENIQSVRIVGHAGLISDDEHWKAFVEGGEVLVTNYDTIPGPDGDPIPEELIGSSEDDADVEFEEGAPPVYGEVYQKIPATVNIGKVFYDHCTSISLPFSKKETQLLFGNVGYNYGNVDYVYNFLQSDYETSIVPGVVNETVLPNLYAVMSAFDQESNVRFNEHIKRHVTLNNALPLPVYKKMKMSKFSTDAFSSKCTSVSPPGGMKIEYLKDWALVGLPRYLNIDNPARIAQQDQLEKRFANILIPEKNIDLINEYNNSKEMFPMYSDISFTTDTATEIAETFSDLNLNCSLMKGMYELLVQQNEEVSSAGTDVDGEVPPEEDGDGWWTAMAGTQAGEVLGSDDSVGREVEYASSNPCAPAGTMSVYANTFYTQTDIPTSAPGSTACDPKLIINSKINTESYRMMDLNEWMDYFHSSLSHPFAVSGVFFGHRQKGMDIAQNSTTEYEKNFLMTVLKSKVQTIVQNNMRRYEDIIDGDFARSEALMYRIAKRRGKGGTVIQNYWISNSNKIDMLNFVDTQVKYDKEYEYEIYVYQIVIGAKYAYKNLAISRTLTEEPTPCIEMFDAKTGAPVPERVPFNVTRNPITKKTKMIPVKKQHRYIAEFDAVVRPSVKILEIPFMKTSAFVVDSPPMPPDINIVPYLHVRNRINIFMNNGVGKEVAHPIFINIKSEGPIVRKYALSKGLDTKEPITYESDDRPESFLVFRTLKKPQSYRDFKGRLHRTIQVGRAENLPLGQGQRSREPIEGPLSSIAMNDKISPNKKYYYTFKTIDYHGNISNPSPVYEVEIVDDQGASYFLMNTIEFKKEEPRQQTITGKRLLQIAPNINQTLINEVASGFNEVESAKLLTNKVVLGLNEVGIWDKRFKIRLTSTKTGKKLDLNIKFVPQRVTTKSDFEC